MLLSLLYNCTQVSERDIFQCGDSDLTQFLLGFKGECAAHPHF